MCSCPLCNSLGAWRVGSGENLGEANKHSWNLIHYIENAALGTNYNSFLKGMKDCEKYINEHYEILQLLGSMPARLQMLIDA